MKTWSLALALPLALVAGCGGDDDGVPTFPDASNAADGGETIDAGPSIDAAFVPMPFAGPCTIDFDLNGDSTVTVVETRTYDVSNQVTRVEVDDITMGTMAEFVITRTYNAQGQLIKEDTDSDNDGTVNITFSNIWGTSGTLNKVESDGSFAVPADGVIDRVTDYTYDSNLNLIRRDFDDDFDTVIDRVDTLTYDSNNQLIEEAKDTNNNGTIDGITTFTYDANGNNTLIEIDNGNNGNVNKSIAQTFDAAGNLTLIEADNNNNGMVNDVTTMTYDVDTNLLSLALDNGNNSSIDRTEAYKYDCWTSAGVAPKSPERLWEGDSPTAKAYRQRFGL
jgi:serralysin